MNEITPAWLRSIGFRLDHNHVDNRPHMTLLIDRDRDSYLEVSEWKDRWTGDKWHVWLRSDMAHSRSKFVFVRPCCTREQLTRFIEALTDRVVETVTFDAEQFAVAWREEEADCKRRYREYCENARWPR